MLERQISESAQHSVILEGDREQLRTTIGRTRIKLQSMGEVEAKLDKQLEEIMGRAINGVDLAMLQRLDLKTLKQLNSGSNQKFDGFVKHFVREIQEWGKLQHWIIFCL